MTQGRKLPPASTRTRSPRWVPDAVLVVRAKDDATLDTVCRILQDALGSYPDLLHVLFEVDARPLTEDERMDHANKARLIPPRR